MFQKLTNVSKVDKYHVYPDRFSFSKLNRIVKSRVRVQEGCRVTKERRMYKRKIVLFRVVCLV